MKGVLPDVNAGKQSMVTTDLRPAESPLPVTERATVPPGPLPWISRMRNAQTSIDPKATLSYIVARSDHEAPKLMPAASVTRAITADFASGTMLQDRYRLMRELGRGGMGIVYLGRDERLARSVAVKVILSDGTGSSTSASLDCRMRSSFAEEARLGASLTHPAIATVFDFGFQSENPFTVFEFIEGETLRELIERRGKLPLDEIRLIIGPIAQALDFAHARRIVHRDLKPENIRATEQRLFKILDLGLAREFGRQDDWRFAGTPAYAAPEQAAERPPDGRTDQYALAVIIFELLTGSRPFQSDSWLDLLEKHYSEPPPSPRSLVPELSETVEAAILKGMEKEPNRRFSTCTELAVALGCQFLTGPAPLPQILLETEIKKMGGRWKTRSNPFANRRTRTHLALAPDALWAIHRAELMRWPLTALYDLRQRGWRGLAFRIRGVAGKQNQWLKFKSRKERRRWFESLEPLLKVDRPSDSSVIETESAAQSPEVAAKSIASPEVVNDPRVEPVVLLKGRPATRFQLLGMVEAKAPNRRRSEGGLAIRAAMMGADAVVDLNAERLPGFIRTEHRASGTAVRAVDQDGRLELKSRWFDSQIKRIRISMLVLALVFGGVSEYVKGSGTSSTVEGVEDARHPFLSSEAGASFNLAAWLIISSLTVGMSFLRWPQLVRPTAVCFLAKAGLNGVHVISSLATIVFLTLSFLRDPTAIDELGHGGVSLLPSVLIPATFLNMIVSLLFLSSYLYLGRRAWRVDQELRDLAAGSIRSADIPWSRRVIGVVAWVLAIGFALILIVWDGGVATQSVVEKALSARKAGGGALEKMQGLMGSQLNKVAWQQLTDPDPSKRGSGPALMTALQAVDADPRNAQYLRTLGVARYRTQDYTGALADFEHSIKLGGFSASSTFFQAMARAQLGELDQARKLYDEADRWMADHQSDDPELKRFREEAAAVLYMKSLDSARAQPKKGDMGAQKPGPKPASPR
jgi:serine/threonine protein kinase